MMEVMPIWFSLHLFIYESEIFYDAVLSLF